MSIIGRIISGDIKYAVSSINFLGFSLDFEESGQDPVHLPHCMQALKFKHLIAFKSSIFILHIILPVINRTLHQSARTEETNQRHKLLSRPQLSIHQRL